MQIENMPYADLQALKGRIDTALEADRPTFTPPQETRDSVLPARQEALSAVYRNPYNPAETWSGYGKPPDWYSMAIDSGYGSSDMRITTEDH